MIPFDISGAIRGALAGDIEDDSAPLDVMAGERRGQKGPGKTPLEQASNLLKVREAAEGLRSGTLSPEDYLARLTAVHQAISNVLGIFEMPQVTGEMARMDEESLQLVEATRHSLEQIEEGLARMVNHLDDPEGEELEQGLAQVEAGYVALDQTHDECLEQVDDEDED